MHGAAEDGQGFWAAGISLVAHMRSPKVPAVHMNTRMIVTTKGWFGGGGDITPLQPGTAEAEEDAAYFHAAYKAACDKHDPEYYPKYKKWCDEYFYLPHRGEARGAGGIFYDYLESGNPEDDFAFTRDVGEAFLAGYPPIVERRFRDSFTPEEREAQLIRRGAAMWNSTCFTTVARRLALRPAATPRRSSCRCRLRSNGLRILRKKPLFEKSGAKTFVILGPWR